MAIEEVITVDVAGLGLVDDLAGALDKAAQSAGKLKGDLASLGDVGPGAAAGAGKLAAAWEKAASSVSASIDRIAESGAKLDGLGAARAGAGPGRLAASWDKAAASVSASIGKMAASGAKLDDLGAGAAGAAGPVGDLGKALDETAAGAGKLGESAAPAADGIKGIGTAAGFSASDLAEFNAVLAENAALSKASADASADASAKIAMGQRLNTAAARDASSGAKAAQAEQSRAARQAAADAEASAGRYHTLALGGAAAIGYGIYKAAQLQTSVTRLYTSAGESQANLPVMTAGILGLSGSTATSQSELAKGAYMIESAGYHGKDALGVLKAAAQGAQAEGAPLGEVGNALTSLMNAYGPQKGKSASQTAMSDMNEIITMVGQGKMTMAGAVGALPAVLPVASAAHIAFPQVAGALATMTSMGMSPDWAAQNLRHTIGSLQNPNTVQTGEMQQLGLNPTGIAKNLGKTGLTGTLDEIQTAVMKSMGPSGMVMLKTFNQSASAAADAATMLKALPPAIQGTARAYLDGSVTQKQWMTDVKAMPPLTANLAHEFGAVANTAHGFNAALRSGQPGAQVYSAAMSKILGGTVGLQTALMLTGGHMSVFQANADAVAQSAQHAGENVKGWADIQKTFNYQLHSFQYSAEAAATTVGTALLPAATGAMKALAGTGQFLAAHPALTKGLALGGGVLGASYLAQKVASPVMTAVSGIGKVAETLHIPGLDKLAGVGQGGAAGGMEKAATTQAGAAATMLDAARIQAEAAGTSVKGTAGRAAGGAAGAEAGAAGASRFKGAAVTAGLGVLATATIVDPLLQSMKNSHGNWLDNAFGTPKTSAWNSWPALGHNLEHYTDTAFGQSGGPSAQQSQFQSRFGISAPGSAPAASATRTAAPKISAPDTSSVDKARADTVRDMQQIDAAMKAGKPPKIPAPDMSALAGAKGKATSDANGITDAVKQAMHNPVKMAAPNISALAAAKGPATADGRNLSAGFAAGIEAGKGAAVAAAQDVASAATAAMSARLETRSPSRVTEKIGKDTSAGFAKGVTSGTRHAKASALTLSAATITSLTQGLEGGKPAIDAAMQAITGKGSRPQDITTIIATISTLKGDVARALAGKQITKGEDSALVKMLTADNGKLQALSAQRTKLETEIADAQQVGQAAISGASIMNASAATPYDPSTVQSSYSIIQGQQYQADQAARFAAAVGKDKKLGLNATSLNQIVQSGAAAGMPVAQGIASGGKAAVTQLNKLQSEIGSSAAKLGGEAAGPMYAAGVQAGQGLAKGLESQLGTLDAAISKMAESMIRKIEKDLKIHSPSQVFADRGEMVPAGMAMGVDRGTGQAAAAVGRMGSRMMSAYHPAMAYAGHGGSSGGSSGRGSGGGDTYVTINMTVQGSVSSQQDLVNAVQRGLLRKGSVNWQTGARRPGSAG